jgi:CheY-like chemotaxis protein
VAHTIVAPPEQEPERIEHSVAGVPVVVVDDDSASQKILRHYLESVGYQVYGILDSRNAVEQIAQIQPQLVILDVLMPYVDGWEVLSQLRSTPATATIPVIMCSIVEQQHLGMVLGANDYLVKPIAEEALMAMVEQWAPPPARVLVVDDDPDARHIIHVLLEDKQCQVVDAVNGVEALAAVVQAKPDLIVLDLMMPEMDGFTVLEQLRANPAYANIPVVVVTAKDLEERERQWLQERSQACIEKGQLSAEEFIAYIQRFVKREVSSGH